MSVDLGEHRLRDTFKFQSSSDSYQCRTTVEGRVVTNKTRGITAISDVDVL